MLCHLVLHTANGNVILAEEVDDKNQPLHPIVLVNTASYLGKPKWRKALTTFGANVPFLKAKHATDASDVICKGCYAKLESEGR